MLCLSGFELYPRWVPIRQDCRSVSVLRTFTSYWLYGHSVKRWIFLNSNLLKGFKIEQMGPCVRQLNRSF